MNIEEFETQLVVELSKSRRPSGDVAMIITEVVAASDKVKKKFNLTESNQNTSEKQSNQDASEEQQ